MKNLLSFIIIALFVSTTTQCGIKRQSGYISDFPNIEKMEFSKDFLFGTSTAAEQMEETPDSDWGKFIQDAYENKRFESSGKGVAKPGHIHNLGDYSKEIILKKQTTTICTTKIFKWQGT